MGQKSPTLPEVSKPLIVYSNGMTSVDRDLVQLFRDQHGLVLREQVLRLGFTPRQIQYRLATGEWQLVHPGVYRLGRLAGNVRAASRWRPASPTGRESVASHASAAWLWGLLPQPPEHPTLTVPAGQHPQRRPALRSTGWMIDPTSDQLPPRHPLHRSPPGPG